MLYMLMCYDDPSKPYLLDGKVIISDYYDDLAEISGWFGINDMESPAKEIDSLESIDIAYMWFSEAWDLLEERKVII